MKTRSQTSIKSSHMKEESDSDSSVYSDLETELKEEDSDSSDDSKTQDGSLSSESDIQGAICTVKKSSIEGKKENVEVEKDEYEYDSSDEEDLRNTVGNIPMNWYNDYPHIGYDLDGKQIIKPLQDDEIDDFLKKIDDPNYWRTVRDKMTGQNVLLTDEDVDIIQRIQNSKYPDASINPYEPFEDFFTYKTMEHPVTNAPEHKRSFIPSKIEKEKVARLVYAIKMGWIKPRKPSDDSPKFYMLWDKENTDVSKRIQHYIPAPKLKLPGHEESYNPPPEYLFSKEEEEKWEGQEPNEKKISIIPRKYSCLRKLPAYPEFIKERLERCRDLYYYPRQRKMRINVDPNDLIPKLPKPKDLQPFPTIESLIYTGHSDMVRCVSVEPAGQFFASGSDDKTVKIWEILTGRCLRSHFIGEIVNSLEWCPNQGFCLLLAAAGNKVYIINPAVGDKVIVSNTDDVLRNPPKNEERLKEKKIVEWISAVKEEWASGIRLVITHPKEVKQVIWHGKGDYFATLMSNAGNNSVIIHQLSCWRSQVPFQRMKQSVQRVLFHPVRPFFFVATQRYVRMYNLLKQELTKKLMTNCKWVSSLAIHPQGDNVIIGSYDSRLSWFDLDLSTKPYKTLRHHKKAIRQVAFHKRYPLFASASDDGSVIVCHGMVYRDLLQNPLIVPVKVLKGHKTTQGLNVLDCCFHPLQPWIFSAGADSTIRLYT